jgi:hypothetical protein
MGLYQVVFPKPFLVFVSLFGAMDGNPSRKDSFKIKRTVLPSALDHQEVKR